MSGVYGDVLSAFPELMAVYTVFRMDPLPGGGGFSPRTDVRKITGIYRAVPGGKLGIEADNRQPNSVGTLWCYNDSAKKVLQGRDYIDVDGTIFLLTKDNGYEKEAGFMRFTVSLVPGPTDQQKKNEKVNLVGDF